MDFLKEENKLSKTDPGAVQHGNFINYYQFNPVEERISKIITLPDSTWKFEKYPYLVLDVGCNSGDLTHQLYTILKDKGKRDIIILAIDIDYNLIDRAQKRENGQNLNIIFKCIDVMNTQQFESIYQFLKKYNRCKFDAVFCLSITMWIHLNHSDEGLKNFLNIISLVSKLFLIEPQPWKCYRTAVRRLKRANSLHTFPNFDKLQWRTYIENEIDGYVQNNLKRNKIHETEPTKWSRKIFVYN